MIILPKNNIKRPSINVVDSTLFQLSSHAFVAMSYAPGTPPIFMNLVRNLRLNELQDESKKLVSTNNVLFAPKPIVIVSEDDIENIFIKRLMKPKEWTETQHERRFNFPKEDILKLIKKCEEVVKLQPSVLKVTVPIKVFGDFHGQFQDLMRFFDLWHGPTDFEQDGDIESYDYLFLGDYIDRGMNNLETICLLMALKIKYPA